MKRFHPLLAAVLMAAAVSAPALARPEPGTFSIVARDPETGELGVAVQSRAFNVGQAVPRARAGVGAIATQAWTNMSFGPRGLDMLEAGRSAEEVLAALLETDERREARQLAVLDAGGATASWTGSECMDWAGGVHRENLAAQGNILASEAVVQEMVAAFESTEGPLAEKLLAALEGAQAAGGDKRGKQSAALLVVVESERHPEYRERFVDLRVDDHPEPIAELQRLYRLSVTSDLVEANLELADELNAAGEADRAERRQAFVAHAMRMVVEDPGATASELNSLAWTIGTRDLYLDEALACADRAATLEPTPEVLDTLAEVQWRRGAFEDAVETGTRALELAPEDAYLEKQLAKYEASRKAGHRVES